MLLRVCSISVSTLQYTYNSSFTVSQVNLARLKNFNNLFQIFFQYTGTWMVFVYFILLTSKQ